MSGRFTRSFQAQLATSLQAALDEWRWDDALEVGVEELPVHGWGGRPDVWIAARGQRGSRPPRVVNLEIEHWSSAKQARRNLEWVTSWVEGDRSRRASVIHLVHTGSWLTEYARDDLFSHGMAARKRLRRFTYDFRIYEVADRRASVATATDLVARADFQALVWQHLDFVGLLR